MNDTTAIAATQTSTHAALRRLFLTLFLRGRSSRGLQKSTAPTSVARKLWLTLAIYALFGLTAFLYWGQSVFALSASLHSMTFLFLGMFIAASGGEVLFNKEEADILLHRPVSPRDLLWAKVRVLIEVSLWLAGALNLTCFIVGATMPAGGWRFPLAHAVSMTLEALFCAGFVVVVYQLCLRWFGRDRLESLMTAAQVGLAVAVAAGAQLAPQLINRLEGGTRFGFDAWWLGILPPIWFAAFDAAISGEGTAGSWALATLGIAATVTVLWMAFGRLARDYERGLQLLGESRTRKKTSGSRRWFDLLVDLPPLRWWLRDSVARGAFLLTAAYLFRDRDVMLRVYPSVAPLLAMPLLFIIRPGRGVDGGFGVAFAGSVLALMPVTTLSVMRYSQQWQASDLFRVAPMPGPASLCDGARRAVLTILTAPMLVVFALGIWLLGVRPSDMLLALPGLIPLPAYALVPCIDGRAVPLSLPSEEARNAGRGLTMLWVSLTSFLLAGLGLWARWIGWFWWLVGIETIVVAVIFAYLRVRVNAARWQPLD